MSSAPSGWRRRTSTGHPEPAPGEPRATQGHFRSGSASGQVRGGSAWEQIFLPEVLLAARAMQAGMEVLKPLLARDGVPLLGKIVIGTVRGDLPAAERSRAPASGACVSVFRRGALYLVCTRCGRRMSLIAFVTDQLARGRPRRRARGGLERAGGVGLTRKRP